MRELLLLAASTFVWPFVCGQCNDLFISEYVEGSANNHAVEIYNPTNQSINLSDYRVTCWLNGASNWSSEYSDTLYGQIGPNEVKVLVLNKRDTAKVGSDTPVYEALSLKADIWLGGFNRSMDFDGDDAISLDKKIANQYLPIDIFGKIGQKPELLSQIDGHTGWSDTFPFHTGIGIAYTKNHSLVRKSNVNRGININPEYFDPTKEWQLYPENNFDSLGSHNCNCNKFPASTKQLDGNRIHIYQNPAQDIFSFSANTPIKNYSILSQSGTCLNHFTMGLPLSGQVNLDITNLAIGLYLLSIEFDNGFSQTVRFMRN